jgi:hypothetical protein
MAAGALLAEGLILLEGKGLKRLPKGRLQSSSADVIEADITVGDKRRLTFRRLSLLPR